MNAKRKIGSGKELLTEAKMLQNEFLKLNTHWSLEDCINAIVEKDCFDINLNAINSAKIVAKGLEV